jgi:hypothetical protein
MPGAGKKKTMLFVGLGAGGLLLFCLIGGLAWHFTHESHDNKADAHEHHKH